MKKFNHLKKHKALANNKETSNTTVNENVLVVNDGEIFKVSKVIDVPKKLINTLVKKAKEETGKDPKIFWNEVAMADEIVKHIIETYLNSESLPASILTGDTSLGNGSSEEDLNLDETEEEDNLPEDLDLGDKSEEEDEETEDEESEEDEETEELPSLDDEEESEESEEEEESEEV